MSELNGSELLTIQEVVQRYKVGRTFIYKELKEGRLRAIKVGRLTRVRPEDADAWIKSLPTYGAAR